MRPGQGEKPEAWIPETWCIVNRWPDNEQKENQPYTQKGCWGKWKHTMNTAGIDRHNYTERSKTGHAEHRTRRCQKQQEQTMTGLMAQHWDWGRNRNRRWNNNTTGTRSEGHREREGDTEGERHDGLGRTHVEAWDRRGRHGMKHERDMGTGEETLRETRTWLRNIHRGHDRLTQETRNWTAARKHGTEP